MDKPDKLLPDKLLTEGLLQLCTDDTISSIIKPRLPAIQDALNRYMEEIERFNDSYGLVKVTNREELIVKHILDSLAPLGLLAGSASGSGGAENKRHFADAGSGAGLPGIPLAICLPDIEFTLIERMGRRAGFLRNVVAVLGLSNCSVEETEMEKAAPGRFDAVTFRAFHPLTATLTNHLFRLLAPSGLLAAYKGRNEKIQAELAEAGIDGKGVKVIPLTVPFLNEERHLVIIPLQ
jgi:16S rRNA (guanine527-N7)-methyltransferase